MPCLSIILSAQVYFFRSEVDLLKNLKRGILLEGDTKMRWGSSQRTFYLMSRAIIVSRIFRSVGTTGVPLFIIKSFLWILKATKSRPEYHSTPKYFSTAGSPLFILFSLERKSILLSTSVHTRTDKDRLFFARELTYYIKCLSYFLPLILIALNIFIQKLSTKTSKIIKRANYVASPFENCKIEAYNLYQINFC